MSRARPLALLAVAAVVTAIGLVGSAAPAAAANEPVNIWLTTTNDTAGRNVTRGLQQQTPISFASTSGAASQTITVNENTTYQQFIGAGATFHRHRGVADELVRRAVGEHPQLGHDGPVQPDQRHRPVVPAQPDGRLGPGQVQLHVRRRSRRPEPQPVLDQP